MGSEWKKVQLDEIATISSGKRPAKVSKQPTEECTVPVIGGGGVSGYTDRALFEEGVLITGRVGTLGKLFAPSYPCWPSDNTLVIHISGANVDGTYLRYAVELSIPQVASMNRGAANPLITQGDIGRLNIPLPPLPEQRAIAHILGTLDDKIELNRQINRTLEAMAQALFKSWFIDFDPVVVNALRAGNPIPNKFTQRACLCRSFGRQAAHYRDNPDALRLPEDLLRQFPDRFQDSELGPIPEGWEISCVANLGDIVCGKTPPTKDPSNYGEEFPFITIPDMHDTVYVTRTMKCLSRKGAETQKNKYIPPNSICVSCIATPGLVVLTSEVSQTNQQINTVMPKDLSPYYIFSVLRMLGQQIKAGGSGGSVFANLNKSRFSQLQVLLPKKLAIDAFHSAVEMWFEKILINEKQSQTLATLRDTLLPKLISGELRLSAAALETLAAQAGVPDAEKLLEDAL